MAEERTFIMVKPDGVARGLVGEVIGRLERKGLGLSQIRMLVIDEEMAGRHYAEHTEKPFFADSGRVHHQRTGGGHGVERRVGGGRRPHPHGGDRPPVRHARDAAR